MQTPVSARRRGQISFAQECSRTSTLRNRRSCMVPHQRASSAFRRERGNMASPKITFIGAGSTVFARALLRDLFTFPDLHDCSIALMDIDEQRLADSEAVARNEAASAGASPRISATTDRRTAL